MDSNAFRTTSDPSPESQKITNQILLAGLLAFLVAGAFPLPSVIRTVAKMASNYLRITVAGTAPEFHSLYRWAPVFPFNLLMIVSAEEPQIHCKHKIVIG